MDSDHYLAIGKIRGRICNANREKHQRSKTYNVERLKEMICKEYKEKLESALQAVETSDWETWVTSVKRTAEDIIGFEEKRQWKGWYDQECAKATQEKNAAYRKTLEERCTRARHEKYRSKRREEKRIHKKKKRMSYEDTGEDKQRQRQKKILPQSPRI
jgi:PAS domain-containing protein